MTNPIAQLSELRQQHLTQSNGAPLVSSGPSSTSTPTWNSFHLLYGKACSLLNCKPNKRFLSLLQSEDLTHLDALDFSRDFLGSSGSMAVAVVCSSLPSLRMLNFSGVGLDNEGCIFLLDCFLHHSALEVLDISNNDLSFAAGQSIKAFTKKRERLQARAVSIRASNTLIPSSTLALLQRVSER
jgi:hypothetical protein